MWSGENGIAGELVFCHLHLSWDLLQEGGIRQCFMLTSDPLIYKRVFSDAVLVRVTSLGKATVASACQGRA